MGVRTEKVILTLDDNGFRSKMAQNAAAARALDKALDDLDGSTTDVGDSNERTTRTTKELSLEQAVAAERTARLNKQLREQAKAAVDAEQGIDRAALSLEKQAVSSRRVSSEIDRLSGRMRVYRDLALTLGPSLVPIGAVAIPAVTGLANQFGAAAAAAGVAVFAFQGVGDALTAVNDAALEPTTANLEKAAAAMEKLSPAGRSLVTRLQELRPAIDALRNNAQGAMFPGLIEGLDHLVTLGPRVNTIITELAGAMGDIAADAGESLASDRWTGFFDFLGREARPTLMDLSATVGSVAHGLAEMWMAFQPLNRDFGSWLRDTARDFDRWAQGLSQTQGFQDFVAYIRENGPRVADAMGALGNALVQVTEALAPLGGPSLKIIEAFADTIATIADSDLGTPILAGAAALAVYNRALAITVGLQTRMAALGGLGGLGAPGGRPGAPASAGMLAGLTSNPAGLAALLGLTGSMTAQQTKDNDSALSRFAAGLAGGGDRIPLLSGLGGGFASLLLDDGDDKSIADIAKPLADAAEMRRLVMLQEQAAGTGREAAAAQRELAGALSKTGKSADLTAADIEVLNQTQTASVGATLQAQSAELNYRNALAAARQQAQANSAGIKGMSEAARENKARLLDLAGSWNSMSEEMRSNSARQKSVRRDFIQTATDMGVPIKRARELAKSWLDIPKKVDTKVDADISAAEAKRKNIDQGLDRLDKKTAKPKADVQDNASPTISKVLGNLARVDGYNAVSTITTIHQTIMRTRSEHARGEAQTTSRGGGADGMTVPALAAGGSTWTVPGQRIPYGDKGLFALAPGEEVITNRNGEADRFRTDRALGLIPAYGADKPGYNSGVAGMANGGGVRLQSPFAPDSIARILDLADRGRFKQLDKMELGFKKLEKASTRAAAALDKEREQRRAVLDQMSGLRSTVAGRLRSDIFATDDSSVFGRTHASGSFGDVIGTLQADISEGRAFKKAVATLRRKGLNGGALEALLAEGDPAAFASLSRSQLAQYERLYNTRQRVTTRAGQASANAVFGRELAQANRELRNIQKQVALLTRVTKEEHREDRQARRKGASRAGREGKRGGR